MASRLPDLKFFSGRSNPELAQKIADANGFDVSNIDFTDFANGEMKVKIEESVRGDDVYILQTTSSNYTDKNMMELFMIAHTAKRASARRITAVIPYIYGSRQDRKTQSREPITIQMMGELLHSVGVDRIITVSLHNPASVAAFGPILVDNISSAKVFHPHIRSIIENSKNNVIIMSPDSGGVTRAKAYANKFGTELGFCYKTRPEENKSEVLAFMGDVKGKTVIIVDDIIDTAGSVAGISYASKERGAKEVHIFATHGILSKNARQTLEQAPIDSVTITDSITHKGLPSIFNVVSLGELLCKTIKSVFSDESVGELFEKEK